jgi:hypothetical protein
MTQSIKTPKPIVLWSDAPAIEEMSNKLESLQAIASTLLSEYLKLPFAKEEADLHHIATMTATDSHNYLLSLIPDDFQMNGLKINKEAAIKNNLFMLPQHPAFDTALFEYNNSGLPGLEKYFQIKGKEVVINQDEWNLFNDQHSIIASSEDEKAMYDIWQEAITAIETLDLYMRTRCNHPLVGPGPNLPLQTIAMPSDSGLKVNYKAFAMLKKSLTKFNA